MSQITFVDHVRVLLLRYKEKHGLTNRTVARHVFRPGGDNYSERTVKHFLADDKPGADWSKVATAVVDSIPYIRRGMTVQDRN